MLAAPSALGHQQAMDACRLDLAGAALVARGSGALWWPEQRLLCVADLHLGRSERLARRGGSLLPPYETRETLDRLAAEVAVLDPDIVACLGDSFDDGAAAAALCRTEAVRLAALGGGRRWIWIAGNHDPSPVCLPGEQRAELALGPLVFRHAARPDGPPAGEVSGHFHPKFSRALGGVAVVRRCFVTDGRRLVLPAFGAYTGGLAADHPALRALFGRDARAILTGRPCLALPLDPARPKGAARALRNSLDAPGAPA